MHVDTIAAEILPVEPTETGFARFAAEVCDACGPGATPLRTVVTRTSSNAWLCEIERLSGEQRWRIPGAPLGLRIRSRERTHKFTIVMIVPTGTDCAVGGHAGDATPAARLLGSVCDELIVHPNVVNASDINELPCNALYVEGSVICRLLLGTVSLARVRRNRILVVTEAREDGPWAVDQVVNTASAARATLGVHCAGVVVLPAGPTMEMEISASGRATGSIGSLDCLFQVLERRRSEYDAVAICSRITPSADISSLFGAYFGGDGPNPWGGAEAALTHAVSSVFGVPSAHAPTLEDLSLRTLPFGRVDPRKAAEAISTSYAYCLFKGLHQAPRVVEAGSASPEPDLISVEDVSCLIIPEGCLGVATMAARVQGVPVIAVLGNASLMQSDIRRLGFPPGQLYFAASYLEAAGIAAALRAGIDPSSIARPLAATPVFEV